MQHTVAIKRAVGRSKRNRNAQSIVLTGVKALSICTKATAAEQAAKQHVALQTSSG
jgi:hypothetical protein